MADDDLTAELDRTADRGYRNGATGAECARLSDAAAADIPRLLAALRAVLELAGKLESQGPPSSALEEDRMFIRQECADVIREAITREITGKE